MLEDRGEEKGIVEDRGEEKGILKDRGEKRIFSLTDLILFSL